MLHWAMNRRKFYQQRKPAYMCGKLENDVVSLVALKALATLPSGLEETYT